MSETETSSLSVITEAATNLPDPVKKGLFGALGFLLGNLGVIPAAWLRRRAQAINDDAAGRSLVATELSKKVAERAINDPALMRAAEEVYLPTAIRKASNRVQVAQRAVQHITDAPTDEAKPGTPDEDWMNAFVRFAEDASSDRLQDFFGRVLAGEIVRPGSFSLSTLRTVAELDSSIAQDFSLVWARSVGDSVDHGPDFWRGEWFSRWKRLAEVGLMAATGIAQYLPAYTPITEGNALWSPMSAGQVRLFVFFSKDCQVRWDHIEFTRIGRQIGGILAPPDYEANIREAGLRLNGPGIVKVELHTANGKLPEVLYQKPAD
ncbi:DUF2806 domain-containing protein [Paracoccus sp. S1E-3]|uniref:DUF2806 domain-containing protein n=1 Tax=Paracoccus sp. S1E-3 TaxID=2756130 RepID=UPI0015EE5D58|nr:DUF2806 domain-containing protein [Paracoccus sp. S1E-3]MBA4490960.1 DUF2806 domain-containing protein [Paracoccus sp. S1E-3]